MQDVLESNLEFYRAFESLNIERMADVWVEDEEVVCIHPGWKARVGFKDVLESWYSIFRNTEYMKFSLADVTVQIRGDSAHVLCIENLSTGSRENPRYASLQAVNGFIRTDSGWKMILHQASDYLPIA